MKSDAFHFSPKIYHAFGIQSGHTAQEVAIFEGSLSHSRCESGWLLAKWSKQMPQTALIIRATLGLIPNNRKMRNP